ncbi:MAG: hypothetical protein L0Y57_01860 [Beijerinckiaceae bacterium]|nr:hypothetical protein [Beijerinckiaceae bacterium]
MTLGQALRGPLLALLMSGPVPALAANWPSSAVGNWTILANNLLGSLQIASQGASGDCKAITGTVFGSPIKGFYCPLSGRISFLRKNAGTNDTFQVYTGSLSSPGTAIRMGGVFANFSGLLGEFNFSASK